MVCHVHAVGRRPLYDKPMIVSLAKIDLGNIHDWGSFHDEFQRVFGFPEFYGRNMDAWVDCMSSIQCEKGKTVTIELGDVSVFKMQHPELFLAIVECSSFVNWRLIEAGEPPVLSLSFRA